MKKDIGLRLSLDEMFQGEYYYTDYDIGGEGHYITINANDKEAFLDSLAREWRERAESLLEQVVLDDYV